MDEKLIRCSYPEWCSRCGVLNVTDIEGLEINSSKCLKFYDYDFPLEIHYPFGTQERGKRCCEGTITIYYAGNSSETLRAEELHIPLNITEKFIFNSTQRTSTELVKQEISNSVINVYHPYFPLILSAAVGGLLVLLVFFIFLSARIRTKKLNPGFSMTKNVQLDVILNDYNPFDTPHGNTERVPIQFNRDSPITSRVFNDQTQRAPVTDTLIQENTLHRQNRSTTQVQKLDNNIPPSDRPISSDESIYVNEMGVIYVNTDETASLNDDEPTYMNVNEGYLDLNAIIPPPCRCASPSFPILSLLSQKTWPRRGQSNNDDSTLHSYIEII
ncbi:uncharacterized protein LOC133196063 [Saccostrea echinata]|uniref:uncharacterized protein LOC133196063 n=1 Tax=Saccostrea echinata TaxID=191078 RepID=UPI002A7F759D|nr:uncharacterized protein LOC133196063 [Saccostrea echinata]